MVESSVERRLAAYRRTFRRSGLPLFIEDYTAGRHVFNRALPFLAAVFVGEMMAAIDLNWPLTLNILALLGGLGILLSAFALVNRMQGRRFWSLPEQVGRPELAVFVLAPALLPLVFGGKWPQVVELIVGNVVLLGLVYLFVGYGLAASLLWACTRVAADLMWSLGQLVRALPLLLVFALVLFVSAEMWQVFAPMPRSFALILTGLFAGLGLVFLGLRVPAEVTALESSVASVDDPPLRIRQRYNLGLTVLVSQGLQVLVVSAGVGLFFIAFGAVAIGEEAMATWRVSDGGWSDEFILAGHRVLVTETLMRVAGAIASFTGLYYAISISTDATYRAEFIAVMTKEMRGVFEARREYLTLRAAHGLDMASEGR